MKLRKLTLNEAPMESTPGQAGEIFAGNLVDERHGGAVTAGYGRWSAGSSLTQTMAVDDIMIVLTGRMTVSSEDSTIELGPGDIAYMPKGEHLTIRGEEDSITAYVTYPHWREAEGQG